MKIQNNAALLETLSAMKAQINAIETLLKNQNTEPAGIAPKAKTAKPKAASRHIQPSAKQVKTEKAAKKAAKTTFAKTVETVTAKVKKQIAAEKPAMGFKTPSADLKAQVIAAVAQDPKNTNGAYYKTYAAFIIACGVKKYGDAATFKTSTLKAAAIGYGLEVK